MNCKCSSSTSICKDHITENVWAEIDRDIARAEKANAKAARVIEECVRLSKRVDERLAALLDKVRE